MKQSLFTLEHTRQLTDDTYELVLSGDTSAITAPGQFVNIQLPGRFLRRPISICDWMGDTLRVVFEVRGEGTEWLSRRKAGDKLDVLGPLGRGFDVSGKKLLVVGGGIGVPPLLGCAKYAASRGGEVHACLGFRDEGHLMLTGDFAEYCRCLHVISDDGSTGRKGFVTELVEEFLAAEACAGDACTACCGAPARPVILACGPRPMLKGVAALAERYGVPCQVSLEERMGCGVGACLVCACKTADGRMKHVCKDGPVFDSREVDWND